MQANSAMPFASLCLPFRPPIPTHSCLWETAKDSWPSWLHPLLIHLLAYPDCELGKVKVTWHRWGVVAQSFPAHFSIHDFRGGTHSWPSWDISGTEFPDCISWYSWGRRACLCPGGFVTSLGGCWTTKTPLLGISPELFLAGKSFISVPLGLGT